MNEPSNLITVCQSCHAEAHSNKKLYQPILRAVIWKTYVEDQQITVPQMRRWLERNGHED